MSPLLPDGGTDRIKSYCSRSNNQGVPAGGFLGFIIRESQRRSKMEGEFMSVGERIRVVRMIEKMDKNVDYSEKLGIRNVSVFHECGKAKK